MANRYPLATWRLVLSPPADGATHMAVDEAIWEAVAVGRAPPTLRLYSWSPPCLSLGRNQPVTTVNRQALRERGYDLVRRPTGGQAVLHIDELTYSVILPLSDPRAQGGILESCERLSAGLVRALEILGVAGAVARRRPHPPQARGPVCFETTADFEVAVGGRKLIGSAQRRGRGTLLQHGALPLWGDITRICPLLVPPADPQRVAARATTLEAVLSHRISWERAAEAMIEGFAQALNLRLEPDGLTPEERQRVEQLRQEKYASEGWTSLV
ncbi:MAG TPA: lipoate--protein ligase family protein [Thermoflexia bacterium]|nr:lipoate--protein ligase family protein [Thermoflexia bacterium]